MKILFINYEFPPLGGGAGNATYNIARQAVKLGHQATVLTSHYKTLKRDEIVEGIRVLRVNCIRKKIESSYPFEMISYVFAAIRFAPQLLKEFWPDKIIAVMSIPSGMVAYYLKKKYSLPYIISLQGGDVPGFFSKQLWFYHLVCRPITKAVWQNSQRVIANSQGLQRLAQKTGGKIGIKIEMIPNGVDLEKFKPNFSQKSKNRFKILFAGRLAQQKGIDCLLEAVVKIRQSISKERIECELVGDGPLKEKLYQKTKRLGIEKIIKFKGWISQNELIFKYQTADVFVLPSLDEGMPNTLSEAMACGLPIVATNIKGNNELVQDNKNGFLVNPCSVQELADKLIELIKNKEMRNNFAQKSLEIIKNYDWQTSAKKYLD